jgi:hypothetical protein
MLLNTVKTLIFIWELCVCVFCGPRIKPRKPADDVPRTVPCPHKVTHCIFTLILTGLILIVHYFNFYWTYYVAGCLDKHCISKHGQIRSFCQELLFIQAPYNI